jgi:serine phosphatase RsbU (regulator of sigma subunit)
MTGFTCGEVRGGNGEIHAPVMLPGLHGVLYSRPCAGPSGGDIHYLSVCGSGLMARVCLADVAGHGEMISTVGAEMHDHLRRSVDVIDERKLLTRLDVRLEAKRLRVMTTAVLATYYPPSRRLTVCYAGHPTGWLYRATDDRWVPLREPVPAPPRPSFVDLPLGTGFSPRFNRHRFRVSPGDRIVFMTDGVIETTSPAGDPFDEAHVRAVLEGGAGEPAQLAQRLLDALRAHAGPEGLGHDDVTFFVAEVGAGPPGPALWHVVRNRLLGGWRG